MFGMFNAMLVWVCRLLSSLPEPSTLDPSTSLACKTGAGYALFCVVVLRGMLRSLIPNDEGGDGGVD